tara:strand:+ start:238 stop:462 length:225 start_codon:yes stop_codon:yes gene_type:complete
VFSSSDKRLYTVIFPVAWECTNDDCSAGKDRITDDPLNKTSVACAVMLVFIGPVCAENTVNDFETLFENERGKM